jgi:hypothetical protein
MDQQYKQEYQIGQAVLASIGGALIPGVVEATEQDKILVRLSEPWVDESGQKSDEAWLTPDKLNPALEEETGGTQALPG